MINTSEEIRYCSYGCGKPAIYHFKNGKSCCRIQSAKLKNFHEEYRLQSAECKIKEVFADRFLE